MIRICVAVVFFLANLFIFNLLEETLLLRKARELFKSRLGVLYSICFVVIIPILVVSFIYCFVYGFWVYDSFVNGEIHNVIAGIALVLIADCWIIIMSPPTQ